MRIRLSDKLLFDRVLLGPVRNVSRVSCVQTITAQWLYLAIAVSALSDKTVFFSIS